MLDLIIKGKKTVEVRANIALFSEMQSDDIILFKSGHQEVERQIGAINTYDSVADLVKWEGFETSCPGAESMESAVKFLEELCGDFPSKSQSFRAIQLVSIQLIFTFVVTYRVIAYAL